MKFHLFLIIILISISLQDDKKDYLKEAAHWVDIVYKKIYDEGCRHDHGAASTFEEISKKKIINCVASASITYQQAGMLSKGKKLGHTQKTDGNIKQHYDSDNLKKSIIKSFTHPQNLKKGTCDFVKVMKKFEQMPKWLKQKGILYVQDSNICISAGKGHIYSCNSTGKKYGKGNVDVLRKGNKAYVFTSLILWAVVPRSFGKSNIPKDTDYKHIPCGF